MTIRLASAFAVLALVGAAQADFSGPYAHDQWAFNANGGDGTANGTTASLVLTGTNAGSRVITLYTIEAPGDGVFSFNWSYTSLDAPRFDTAGYILAGSVVKVTQTSGQSGSVSVAALQGDTIGFFVDSAAGMDGAGVLTVNNFTGPAPSGAALGACCLIQPGCVLMSAAECSRRGGSYLGDGASCSPGVCGGPDLATLALDGPGIDLSTIANCNAFDPELAFNSQDNEFVVAWQESSLGPTAAVAAQRVTVAGTLAGAVRTVVLPAFQISPVIAHNANDNEYLIAWRWQGSPGFNSLNGQRFAADLTPIGSVFQLTTGGVGFEATVLHNPANNEYLATARRFDPEPGGVFGARIAGSSVIQPSIEFDTAAGINFSFPAPTGDAALNSLDNQYLVTYAVQEYPTWSCFNLRGRIANADGSLAGAPFEITFLPHRRSFFRASCVAFDSNAGRFLVVYGDTNLRPLHGQFVNRDGTLLGLPFEISAATIAPEVAARMAFDPVSNVYLVAWPEDPAATQTRILAQLLAADGTPLGEPLVLTNQGARLPYVAANTNDGGFLVAWRDRRNVGAGSRDIFGQFLRVETVCPGDLNGDLVVDLTDLATLLAHFGTASGATLADGDLNGDGAVDLTDLARLLSNFGQNCG